MDISQEALLAQYDALQKPENAAIKSAFDDATAFFNLPPLLLYAVSSREVGMNPEFAHGRTGDGGHGHGMFQDDDRWNNRVWPSFDNDVRQQAATAAGKLVALYAECGGWFEASNAYNAGTGATQNGNDTSKTASGNSRGVGDYGPDTMERWATLLLYRYAQPAPKHGPTTWGRH